MKLTLIPIVSLHHLRTTHEKQTDLAIGQLFPSGGIDDLDVRDGDDGSAG